MAANLFPASIGVHKRLILTAESAWAKATLQGTADNVTRFQNTLAATAASESYNADWFCLVCGGKIQSKEMSDARNEYIRSVVHA